MITIDRRSLDALEALNRKYLYVPDKLYRIVGERLKSGQCDLSNLIGEEVQDADCCPSALGRERLGKNAFIPTTLRTAPGLYVSSREVFESLMDRPRFAVVGTRDPSPYGVMMVRRIVNDIASAHPDAVIVGGLSIGIERCAHESALDCGLATMAVLPCGIDSVYPLFHQRLAGRICDEGGVLATPMPPESAVEPVSFLRRSGVIAELADKIIVVEARSKGTSIVTAKCGAGFGRKVYAVPGRMDDVRSEGCLNLISQGVAYIYSDAAARY